MTGRRICCGWWPAAVLALALLTLQGALAASQIPLCSSDVGQACPKPGARYVVCQEGTAKSQCKAQSLGRFSLDECEAQCIWGPDKPLRACAWGVGWSCPKQGKFAYCLEGKAVGGCHPLAMNGKPFPKEDCAQQCQYEHSAPMPACPNGVGVACHEHGKSVFCRQGSEQGKCSSDPFPMNKCASQCMYDPATPPPNCPSGVGTECAQDEGKGFYCRRGADKGKCRSATTYPPFPVSRCTQQCVASLTSPLRWCPDGYEHSCSSTTKWYLCEKGLAEGECSATAHHSSECSKQCQYMPGGPAGVCAPGVGKDCPRDGKYFYCSDKGSKAYNGCRAYAKGEFPQVDCAAQCVHGADEAPPVCPDGVGNKCPADGEEYLFCRAGESIGHCRKARTQGMWPSRKCNKACVYKATLQPAVFGDCPPGVGTSCLTQGSFFYCTSGNSYRACQPTSKGPLPAVDCQAQCIYAASSSSIPDLCSPGVGIECPEDGTKYNYCMEGGSKGSCRSWALGTMMSDDCKKSCVYQYKA